MTETIEQAQRNPQIAVLSAADRETLAASMAESTLRARQPLYDEGQQAPGLVWIIDGVVKLERRTCDGRSLIVALAGPGDMFGMCCQPYTATKSPCGARTLTACRVLTVPAAQWRNLYTQHPTIGRALVSVLMASRLGCTELGLRMVFHPVENRLAHLLLKLHRWGYGSGGGRPEIPRILSQSEMAQAIGSVREVVSRSLASLQQRGILHRSPRRIVIRDQAALEELAA